MPNRVDFSIRFPCFFQKPTNRKKLSAHGKMKSKHNWIGLEAGGEKKTTTRSNQKCKCATISKCAQNAFNGYKNRQRQALRKERRERADCERLPPTNLVRSDIFILHIVHPKSVGSCLHLSALAGPITDALAKPIFDLHGKLSAGCIPPFICALSLPPFGAGNWRVAAATHRQREGLRERERQCNTPCCTRICAISATVATSPSHCQRWATRRSHWCRGHLFYILDKLIIITLSISLCHCLCV